MTAAREPREPEQDQESEAVATGLSEYSLDGLPDAGWEMVTPEMARDALASMRRNRSMRATRIDRMKRDILAGRWRGGNGETVKQGADGLWDDGQHRFTAIYRAGVAVPMLIVRGITPDDAFTVDSGAIRSYPDRLRMKGMSSAQVLGPIIRRMWYWDVKRQYIQSSRDIMPSDQELEDYRRAHETELMRCLPVAAQAGECWLTPTVLGTLAIILRRIDDEEAAAFLTALVTGAELKAVDPVYALRRRLMREAESPQKNYETRRALAMMAWNLRRDGKEVESLQLPKGREITNRNYPLPY